MKEPLRQLIPHGQELATESARELPTLVAQAGNAARYAYEEFLFGELRNPNTRAAYESAIHRFADWCQEQGIELRRITPKDIGQYFDSHPGGVATRKQHLSALRHLFDRLVTRHALILNPAASVRGERYQVLEGKTHEITIEQARTLLASIDTGNVVGLRDRAAIATMIYTAARVGAVAKVKRGNLYNAGDQWCIRFHEKGGKSREIPVRHDLQGFLFTYIKEAGLANVRVHATTGRPPILAHADGPASLRRPGARGRFYRRNWRNRPRTGHALASSARFGGADG